MPVKSSAAGGQPAGKQSNVEQTLVSTPDSTTDNPLLGPMCWRAFCPAFP